MGAASSIPQDSPLGPINPQSCEPILLSSIVDETNFHCLDLDECLDEEGTYLPHAPSSQAITKLIEEANTNNADSPLLGIKLSLEGIGLTSINNDTFLPNHVKSLNLSSNLISCPLLFDSENCGSLLQLDLSSNSSLFQSGCEVSFNGCKTTLLYLDVSFISLEKSSLYKSLTQLVSLRHLSCDTCELDKCLRLTS